MLMCQVLDGEPPIQIKWFKDDQELTGSEPSGRFEPGEQVELIANEELGGASLLFRRAQRQHSGNYTCLATNHFGTSSYSSVMSVRGKFLCPRTLVCGSARKRKPIRRPCFGRSAHQRQFQVEAAD